MTHLSATLTALGIGLLSLAALPPSAAAQDSGGETETAATIEEMRLGNPDADVTVVEYASFTCPHCRDFHETVFDRLKEEYIDPGEINFIYREIYFERDLPSLWAGMVARCGGSERFFGIVDLIYGRQQEWVQGDRRQVADNLRRIGRTAGLTGEQLDSCLSDGDMATALVEHSMENQTADDITSTPSFVVDGTKYSNMSYEEFSSILDEKLGQ